jgi:hypothetical protein
MESLFQRNNKTCLDKALKKSLISFLWEMVFFGPGSVNLRDLLGDAPLCASALSLEILAWSKKAMVPNWHPNSFTPGFPDKN